MKELMANIHPEQLLPSAFEKCGLVPINRQKVLERIPSILDSQEIGHNIDSALLKRLEARRFGEGPKRKTRGPKLPAGQSYSAENEEEEEEEEEDVDSLDEEEEEEVSSSDVDVDELLTGEEAGGSGIQRRQQQDSSSSDEELPDPEERRPAEKIPGTQVVALYEGEWFLAEVMDDQNGCPGGYTRLNFMTIKGKNMFMWGTRPDLVITYNDDILLENVQPEPANSRGHFRLNKKDLTYVQTWMVVVYCPFFPIFLILTTR